MYKKSVNKAYSSLKRKIKSIYENITIPRQWEELQGF